MKRYLGFCIFVLTGALVFGGLSGCSATERPSSTAVMPTGARPSEVQPVRSVRPRSKQTQPVVPITIAKAGATPTPSPKGTVKKKIKAKGVPTNTAVTLDFLIDAAACPGVEEADVTAKCYQITSLSNGSTPSVVIGSTPLAVFKIGSTTGFSSVTTTMTPGVTTPLYLSFPSSTAGMQVIVIMTGQGEDSSSNVVDFSGAQILVVNP